MESRSKFYSPQNISGALQQNSVGAFPWTTEVAGDLFQYRKTENKQKNKKHQMAQYPASYSGKVPTYDY